MSDEISKGMKVKVTGTYERGAEGTVTKVESGWCSKIAVIEVPGLVRSKTIRVPVGAVARK